MPYKKCKICGKEFNSDRSLHLHTSRVHNIDQKDYYHKYFPRYNLLNGNLIPFKNKKDYFQRDFSNRAQLIQWCNREDPEIVKDYIKKILRDRIIDKNLNFAPSHIELEVHKLPTVDIYKSIFGSYSNVCKELGVELLFDRGVNEDFINKYIDLDNLLILVDTREKQPLNFKNSYISKLDFGDYTASGDFYSKTYIDRKSEGDFKSTLTQFNIDRFRAEIQRAKDFDSYLYIVVESSLDKIKINNNFCPHKSKLPYVFHNMRVIQHEFRGNCQFIFSGGRRQSELVIPKLLFYGKKIWNVDVQYYIDKYGINS